MLIYLCSLVLFSNLKTLISEKEVSQKNEHDIQAVNSLTKTVQKRKKPLEALNAYNIKETGIVTIDINSINEINFEMRRIYETIFVFPHDILYAKEAEPYEQYLGCFCPNDKNSRYYNENNIFNMQIKSGITDTTAKIIKIPITSHYYNNIISTSPNEYILFDNYTNKNANYISFNRDYRYIQASLQDIETEITITKNNIKLSQIKDNYIDTETTVSESTKIKGPFIALIDAGTTVSFKTTLIGSKKQDLIDDYHKYFGKGSQCILSTKYGTLTNININSKSYSIPIHNIETLKITANNFVYIKNPNGWIGEIIYPILSNNLKKFGPHLNRHSFYSTYDSTCTFWFYNYIFKNNSRIYFLEIETFLFDIPNNFKCDKYIVHEGNINSIKIGTKYADGVVQLNSNENLCIHHLGKGYYRCLDSTNENNSYLISNIDMYRISSYYDCKKYGYDYSYGCYYELYSYNIIGIANNNPESVLTIDFQKEIEINENYFYNQFEPNKENDFVYLNNEKEEIDDSGDFEGESYTIHRKHGYNFVNMVDKDLFTINTPQETLIYFHNLKGYQVDCYDSDGLFGTINDTSANRVVQFGKEGYMTIRKIEQKSSKLKLLTDFLPSIYFSYISFYKSVDRLFICSNPNKTVLASTYQDNDEYGVYLSDGYTYNYLWFTYPFDVEINMSNQSPHEHQIYKNGKWEYIYTENFSIIEKDVLFRINVNNQDEKDPRYSAFKVFPKNVDDLISINYFDLLNDTIRTHPISIILDIKDEVESRDIEEEKKESWIEENLGIIVVIICVVVGLIIIVVIVVIVIKIKRKKNQVENSSINENDDIANEKVNEDQVQNRDEEENRNSNEIINDNENDEVNQNANEDQNQNEDEEKNRNHFES